MACLSIDFLFLSYSATHFPQLHLPFVQYFQFSAFRSAAGVCSQHQIKRFSGRHQKHVAYGGEVLIIVMLGISGVTGSEASIFTAYFAFAQPVLWNFLYNNNRFKRGTKNCLPFEFHGKIPTPSKRGFFFFINQCVGMALKINTFSSNREFSLERRREWVWDFHFRASQT